MINLTPHAISLELTDGKVTTFPPSGQLARVATIEVVIGETYGVPLINRTMGEVTGLPPEGVECLVSGFVGEACKGRAGVFIPDTGSTAIRENGQIKAVTRLVAA